MMPKHISFGLTGAVLLLVVGLGAWMWNLHPEGAVKWAVSMFMLPVAWGGLMLFKKGRSCGSESESDQHRLRRAIMGAGLVLAVALGLKIMITQNIIDAESSKRAMGAILGVVLMVFGNAIPKTLKPLSDERCGHARGQSLRRFAGWAFVLSGLGYSIAWLVAPFELTRVLSMTLVATSVVLVAAACIWSAMTHKRMERPAES